MAHKKELIMHKLKNTEYNWLIILALIIIAPLGLFFIIKYRQKWWSNKVIRATAIILTIFFGAICIGAITNPQTNNVTTAIETKEIKEKDIIRHEVEHRNDNTLAKGEEKIITEGVDGEKTIIYEIKYENGEETSRNKLSETVTKEPIDEVIVVGTYIAPSNSNFGNSSRNNSSSPNNSPNSGVTDTVSGYCNDGTYVTGSPSAKGKASACYGHNGWRDY